MRIDTGLAIATLVALAAFLGCGKTEPALSGPDPSVKNEGNPAAEGRADRRGPAELPGQAASQGQDPAGKAPGEAPSVGNGLAGGAGDGARGETGTPSGSEAAAETGNVAQGGTGEGGANANSVPAGSGTGSANEDSERSASGDRVAENKAASDYAPPPFQTVDETKWEKKARSDMLMFLENSYRHRIKDPRVLTAMGNVPRHLYILPEDREAGNSYKQMWYKIGYGQTITDPGMVAYMTQLLAIKPTDKVLEIGTGSGYQGSVLVQLTPNVFTIEIVEKLANRTHKLLDSLGYSETVLRRRIADGYWGWEEEAPFDKIIVTCAADHVPVPLLQQLRPGGLMVVPVGPRYQPGKLHFIAKDEAGQVHEKVLGTVEFVPLTRKKVEKTHSE
jgi:protein-L-isoaspartate(D-aspartate) O-methyltransferase